MRSRVGDEAQAPSPLLSGAALVFHLKNHYALVFALREWTYEAADGAADGGEAAPRDGAGAARDGGGGEAAAAAARANAKHTVAVRQLLTSRRGQRPSAWIDWDEARATMLGWEGYKMMLVERRAP